MKRHEPQRDFLHGKFGPVTRRVTEKEINGFSPGEEKVGFEVERTENGDRVVSGGISEIRF